MPAPTFPSHKIGDMTITAISDGYLAASIDFLTNIEPSNALQIQNEAKVENPADIHINCYLIRSSNHTILIDAGIGNLRQSGGYLKQNLLLAGVHPAEINTILLTHAHPDHVGGLMEAENKATFPNAELVVNQHELAFWQDDSNLSRATERARGNFQIARQVFDIYQDRIRTFDQGGILSGVTAIPLPGHTPGHTGFQLDSGDDHLLIWGDITHFPHIQAPKPDVSISFDQDATLAAETRKKILEQACSENLLVAGMHLDEFGFAHIKRKETTFRVVYNA